MAGIQVKFMAYLQRNKIFSRKINIKEILQLPTSFSNDLPKGWVWTIVGRAIEKVSLSNKKLKKRDYECKGKLPVIDQGTSFIGGYTDNEKLKLNCQLPVVVFGDHTKINVSLKKVSCCRA